MNHSISHWRLPRWATIALLLCGYGLLCYSFIWSLLLLPASLGWLIITLVGTLLETLLAEPPAHEFWGGRIIWREGASQERGNQSRRGVPARRDEGRGAKNTGKSCPGGGAGSRATITRTGDEPSASSSQPPSSTSTD